MSPHRPRLALPFTILHAPDIVHLVAGEDHRYTLTAPGLDSWLPALLARCDGATPVADLLAPLTSEQQTAARQLFDRLLGERLLIEGPPELVALDFTQTWTLHGEGPLAERLRDHVPHSTTAAGVLVYCQDRLDYATALDWNRTARKAQRPLLWVSHAALSRGYVSPLFLADTGPCLGCLLGGFHRLSPAREIHDALLEHGRLGRRFEPAPFPEEALTILEALVRWKLRLAQHPSPPRELYRLHVVERDSLEVSTERVFIDPECGYYQEGRT